MKRSEIRLRRRSRKRASVLLALLGSAVIAGVFAQGCGSGKAPAAPTESDSTPASRLYR